LDWDSRWSTPSLSPLNSGDLALDEETDDEVIDVLDVASDPVMEQVGPFLGLAEEKSPYQHPPHSYAHRKGFEALQKKQYWREEWKGDGAVEKGVFSMGDASTLGRLLLAFCSYILTRFHIQVLPCVPSYGPQVTKRALLVPTLIFLFSLRYVRNVIFSDLSPQ
jgi:hypothetical protein